MQLLVPKLLLEMVAVNQWIFAVMNPAIVRDDTIITVTEIGESDEREDGPVRMKCR